MPQFETITLPFGQVRRRHAPIKSSTLLALPENKLPPAALACATCPDGSWYMVEDALACYCAARHYVSWLLKQKAIILCDDRERALGDEADQDAQRRSD